MIQSADLLDPVGDISPTMFPDDTARALDDRLTAYIDRAVVAASTIGPLQQNEAIARYTYYLAYTAVAALIAAKPTSASLTGLGSATYDIARSHFYRGKAEEALLKFNALLPIPVVQSQGTLMTQTIRTVVRF